MVQSKVFEPPGPFHLSGGGGDGYPQGRTQDLASVLRHVVVDQNGNTNPSHHTVLLLMELRANLENRHYLPNACQEPESVIWDINEAMHLSTDFLQSMIDLNGKFKPLVTSCLDLAEQIIHVTDTSELGNPDAVSTIKQLRKLQSVEMHDLRERWGDLLQAASNHDESATFQRLSDIVEYTEDVVYEAWLDAKSFVSSCEEQIRYHLDDTFLAGIYASAPMPSVDHECHSPPEENPELAVLHHTLATSHVDTTTVCATVAHLSTPRNTTPPLMATLGRHNPVTASDAATSPPLGPERKGYTPVYDPDSAHSTVTGRHFDDLSTTLHTQKQRVDDAMTDIIGHVEDDV